MQIAALVSIAEAVITAAPDIEKAVGAVKDFITNLVSAGVITADQQTALHAHVDSVAAAVASGQTPPEFTVEPDPS